MLRCLSLIYKLTPCMMVELVLLAGRAVVFLKLVLLAGRAVEFLELFGSQYVRMLDLT